MQKRKHLKTAAAILTAAALAATPKVAMAEARAATSSLAFVQLPKWLPCLRSLWDEIAKALSRQCRDSQQTYLDEEWEDTPNETFAYGV